MAGCGTGDPVTKPDRLVARGPSYAMRDLLPSPRDRRIRRMARPGRHRLRTGSSGTGSVGRANRTDLRCSGPLRLQSRFLLPRGLEGGAGLGEWLADQTRGGGQDDTSRRVVSQQILAGFLEGQFERYLFVKPVAFLRPGIRRDLWREGDLCPE